MYFSNFWKLTGVAFWYFKFLKKEVKISLIFLKRIIYVTEWYIDYCTFVVCNVSMYLWIMLMINLCKWINRYIDFLQLDFHRPGMVVWLVHTILYNWRNSGTLFSSMLNQNASKLVIPGNNLLWKSSIIVSYIFCVFFVLKTGVFCEQLFNILLKLFIVFIWT